MTVLGKPFSHLMDTVVDIDALVHRIAVFTSKSDGSRVTIAIMIQQLY